MLGGLTLSLGAGFSYGFCASPLFTGRKFVQFLRLPSFYGAEIRTLLFSDWTLLLGSDLIFFTHKLDLIFFTHEWNGSNFFNGAGPHSQIGPYFWDRI